MVEDEASILGHVSCSVRSFASVLLPVCVCAAGLRETRARAGLVVHAEL